MSIDRMLITERAEPPFLVHFRVLVRLRDGIGEVILIIFDVVGLLGIHRPHSTFMPMVPKGTGKNGPLDQWRHVSWGGQRPPVSGSVS